MEAQTFLALAVALVAFGLVSARLSGTILTAPILFVAAGLLLGPLGLHVVEIDFSGGAIETVAEFTLVLVLFTDAARIDVRTLWRYHNLPTRMLLVGLPLTILAGIAAAMAVFPGLPIFEAALLAAILAPTDAALGQAVVSDRVIPVRIRQTLNAESGMNDGIALPVVLLFASLALATEGPAQNAGDWVQFGLLQITLGPLAGLVTGYIGGRLIDRASAVGWMTPAFQGLSALGVVSVRGGHISPDRRSDHDSGCALCTAQPDRCAHGAGGDQPAGHGVELADLVVPRLVRPPGTGLDPVCAAGVRWKRGDAGITHSGNRVGHGIAERTAARHHRRAGCPLVRAQGCGNG